MYQELLFCWHFKFCCKNRVLMAAMNGGLGIGSSDPKINYVLPEILVET
jgi:hypothetical protein